MTDTILFLLASHNDFIGLFPTPPPKKNKDLKFILIDNALKVPNHPEKRSKINPNDIPNILVSE